MALTENQLKALSALVRGAAPMRAQELAAAVGLDQSPLTVACDELRDAGHVVIEEREHEELSLGDEAAPYASAPLPERVLVGMLHARGGRCEVTAAPQHCALSASQVGQSIRWLNERGWAKKVGAELVLTNSPPDGAYPRQPDELLIEALAGGRVARSDELARAGLDVAAAVKLLSKRRGFLNVKPRKDRLIAITESGRALLASGARARPTVTQLTPELLSDGSWRQADLRPYDVTLAAQRLYPGKEHAFQRTLDKVRRVFLEMGFTEIVSPWVESSFWDFDALFQPQDHPARDMQDTFYVARPSETRLPAEALVERVKAAHEDGGDTGSTGWRYRWSRDLARKPVLRTHTTAATIRALAEHARRSEGPQVARSQGRSSDLPTFRASDPVPSRPGKYFIVGPVYRREAVDYKHLPMFHQVDGIIVDRQASLSTLLGTLAAFYGKMGFPKVRFRPSFFPYTEPSAEAFLWFEQRQEWVEMGGSGIFRPEVTRPLGIHDRVLAWGLGLERLAMMIHGLKAIGDLYFAAMPWLREAPMCRA